MNSLQVGESLRALIARSRLRHQRVTDGDILRFAQAIGESPRLRNGRLEAPLLFCQALTYEPVPPQELPADGSPCELDVPVPAHRAVGGSSKYTIHRRVVSGEVVTIESRLRSVDAKRGSSGELYLIEVVTTFSGADGELISEETATYIKRA